MQAAVPQHVLTYVQEREKLLTTDVSNYAKGRRRAWLGLEAPLSDNRLFMKVHPEFSYRSILWDWLAFYCEANLAFKPEIALLHVGGADCSEPEENATDGRGGECGITMHRDAGYADYRAVGINLTGNAVFGYRQCYPSVHKWTAQQDEAAELQRVVMTPGTSVVFNCKNPHFGQAGPNRWCINAWRISHKRRDEFERARACG